VQRELSALLTEGLFFVDTDCQWVEDTNPSTASGPPPFAQGRLLLGVAFPPLVAREATEGGFVLLYDLTLLFIADLSELLQELHSTVIFG